MRAAFWRARLRLRKQRAAGPDLILRVAGLVFAALVVAVIVVLVWERLHQ
jgi:hypothetical protein